MPVLCDAASLDEAPTGQLGDLLTDIGKVLGTEKHTDLTDGDGTVDAYGIQNVVLVQRTASTYLRQASMRISVLVYPRPVTRAMNGL